MKNVAKINILLIWMIFSSCQNESNDSGYNSKTFYDDSGNLSYQTLTNDSDSLILFYFPNKIIKEIKYYLQDTIVYYKKFNASGDILDSVIKPRFEIKKDELVISLRYLYYDKSCVGVMFGDSSQSKTLEEITLSKPMIKSISIPISELPKYNSNKVKGRVIELYPPSAVLGFYDFDIDLNKVKVTN
ncbi:MAG: hypothetical protein KDC79_07590 [Cyclobacteriaceae bacterium]|nr:hypothetical protein [Cyclobacteriaceae bacterium]